MNGYLISVHEFINPKSMASSGQVEGVRYELLRSEYTENNLFLQELVRLQRVLREIYRMQ